MPFGGFLRRRVRIPDAGWTAVLEAHPFLTWRSVQDLQALRGLCEDFLARKEFHGAHGLVVTDEMALAVAAQACLPILHLGIAAYDGFVGIVMHDGPVIAKREVVDENGLVHTYDEELVGEAVEGGPVMLSWHEGITGRGVTGLGAAGLGAAGQGTAGQNVTGQDVGADQAYNVVIHEFVHLLDLLDGQFDGTPPLPAARRQQWADVMQRAFDRFDERSACGYASVVDDYGAQDIGEFFAVTAEAFFTMPIALQDEMPEVYDLYVDFFIQDTAMGQRTHSKMAP